MPRHTNDTLNTNQRARQYTRTHRMGYDALYHLYAWANEQDGRPSTGIQSDVPAIEDLSAEDQAALTAAKAEIGA